MDENWILEVEEEEQQYCIVALFNYSKLCIMVFMGILPTTVTVV
jgi:hypothetical protein